MDDGRHEALVAGIINQVPDLYIAELIQLADYIRGLKAARALHKIS